MYVLSNSKGRWVRLYPGYYSSFGVTVTSEIHPNLAPHIIGAITFKNVTTNISSLWFCYYYMRSLCTKMPFTNAPLSFQCLISDNMCRESYYLY